ncbi:hypothetical protein LUZ60_012572 [Juncus effusus]|nr:hypothetical protein LUZ60_012572 [Juncus effusus]
MDGNFGKTEQILWPASILTGIFMCKLVYEITSQVSSQLFKGYNGLIKVQRIEWNNRGFSTFHALLVAAVSFYLVFLSDIFQKNAENQIIIDRKSWLSDGIFGVSIGYFLSDLAMIFYFFPKLGGMEYVVHHALSMYSIILALLSGKAHVYILMVLFTEATTPIVNLRWYLDLAGKKSSNLYVYNGLALFVGWLVARILLFVYFYNHMYLHFDQVKSIFPLGFYSILTVPSTLALMNIFWFWKIFNGLLKTLSRKNHTK